LKKEIYRTTIIEDCRLVFQTKHKVLLVQAQAGQGKTTLIRQFEENSDHPFAWVTCTENDSPHVLAKKIFQTISHQTGPHSTLSNALVLETISSVELVLLVPQVIKSYLESRHAPITLVFDDTHLLDGAPESLQLLRGLVDATPDFVTYAIVSRRTLLLNNVPLFRNSEVIQVDNELLAFSREETALLYLDKWGIPIKQAQLNKLMDITEGWVTGLTLLRNWISADGGGQDQPTLLASCFSELISGLKDDEKEIVYLFSLLNDLPTPLIQDLGMEKGLPWLKELAEDQLFVYERKEGKQVVFRLHHLFQDYIKEELKKFTSSVAAKKFLVGAGTWLLELGHTEQSLACYRRAEAWNAIDNALQKYAEMSPLLWYHEPLSKELMEIPPQIQLDYPWIAYSLGAIMISSYKEEGIQYILKSLEKFNKRDDKNGELAALSFYIVYNVMHNPNFKNISIFIKQAVSYFKEIQDSISPQMTAKVCQALILGAVYQEKDIKKAKYYLNLSCYISNPSTKHIDTHLFLPGILIDGVDGNINAGLKKISFVFPNANNHVTSIITRFSLYFVQANFLLMSGAFVAYEKIKEASFLLFAPLIKNTYFESFFAIWDADLYLSRGEYEQILSMLQRKKKEQQANTPHILSQFCHYEMLANAHLGNFPQMKSAMHQALRSRAHNGGGYFIHLTHMLTACALVLADETSKAERIFNKVLRSPAIYHTPTAYAYRAFLRIRQEDIRRAKEDVSCFLQLMERFGNLHSFGLSPKIMEVVLPFAVKNKLHEKTARLLSRQRLECDILDDGTVIPLLHIDNIGPMRLRMEDKEFSAEKIPGRLKRILALVADYPAMKLTTSKIRTSLWPNDDDDETEGRFDAMLSRARADFSKMFGKKMARHHVVTQQKTLSLPHCVTHEQKAVELGKKGKSLFTLERFWEAHTKFIEMAHWLGPSFLTPEFSKSLGDKTLEWLPETLLQWAMLLKRCNDCPKALDIIEQALDLEPLDDSLLREKYTLLTLLNKPAKAAQALKEYGKLLREHDFSDDQVAEIIDNVLYAR
jgi:ATP/maltotriose-dependent transcriptional regulator MalT